MITWVSVLSRVPDTLDHYNVLRAPNPEVIALAFTNGNPGTEVRDNCVRLSFPRPYNKFVHPDGQLLYCCEAVATETKRRSLVVDDDDEQEEDTMLNLHVLFAVALTSMPCSSAVFCRFKWASESHQQMAPFNPVETVRHVSNMSDSIEGMSRKVFLARRQQLAGPFRRTRNGDILLEHRARSFRFRFDEQLLAFVRFVHNLELPLAVEHATYSCSRIKDPTVIRTNLVDMVSLAEAICPDLCFSRRMYFHTGGADQRLQFPYVTTIAEVRGFVNHWIKEKSNVSSYLLMYLCGGVVKVPESTTVLAAYARQLNNLRKVYLNTYTNVGGIPGTCRYMEECGIAAHCDIINMSLLPSMSAHVQAAYVFHGHVVDKTFQLRHAAVTNKDAYPLNAVVIDASCLAHEMELCFGDGDHHIGDRGQFFEDRPMVVINMHWCVSLDNLSMLVNRRVLCSQPTIFEGNVYSAGTPAFGFWWIVTKVSNMRNSCMAIAHELIDELLHPSSILTPIPSAVFYKNKDRNPRDVDGDGDIDMTQHVHHTELKWQDEAIDQPRRQIKYVGSFQSVLQDKPVSLVVSPAKKYMYKTSGSSVYLQDLQAPHLAISDIFIDKDWSPDMVIYALSVAKNHGTLYLHKQHPLATSFRSGV